MAKGPSRPMMIKMTVIMCLIVFVAFGTLLVQLVNLQFINSDYYQRRAIDQQLRTTTLSAKRGDIYDCNMKKLATSATAWNVVLAPANIEDDDQLNLIADGLSEILGVDRETIIERGQKKSSYYEVIAKKIEKSVYDEIVQFSTENKIGNAIDLIEDFKRYYPYNDLAASVIGFTSSDNSGLEGLEAKYDSVLKGIDGKAVSAKNALNTDMPFEYQTQIPSQDGNSLVLTIDETIQTYVEDALEKVVAENKVGNRATAIMMDVNTCAVLAMATEPDYDLNEPFELYSPAAQARVDAAKTEEERSELLKNELQYQWNNKAIVETYEPGSVFKTFTSAMAIEENLVSDRDRFSCPGYHMVAGIRINCAHTAGHGILSFTEALQNSCNPSYMQIAERIGPTTFSEYFEAFGFTEKTGIDLYGETSNAGLYYTAENMHAVELATASFGQTFKVTPIQIITAFCSAVNGGKLMQPYIVSKVIDNDGNIVSSTQPTVRRQVISEENSAQLREMLESVVSVSGGRNAYLSGYRIGGKTGTSQKQDKYADDGTRPYRIASFCGFAPADDPQIAMLVIIDEPMAGQVNGGAIAAPVLREVFEETLPYLGIQPQYTEEELAKADTRAPAVVGQSLTDAKTKLTTSGFSIKVVGNGQTVLEQIPQQYTTMPRGGTIVLYTDETSGSEGVTVPDFSKMSPAQANAAAAEAGLNLRLTGVGQQTADAYCIEQSKPAGIKVAEGMVVTLKFFHDVEEDVENLIE